MHEGLGYTNLIEFNPTLVMNMITLLVLFLILKKFFWDKVRKFMLDREEKVRDSFDNADQVNKLADARLQEYTDKMKEIEQERREVIKNATLQAEERNRKMLEDTNKKVNELMVKAKAEIEREKSLAVADMREQISTLSIMAAEKIIGVQLQNMDTDPIIDDVINSMSNAKENSVTIH
ncbi:MAG: F0F1 ATP synthase subunit B [Clostridiales Family XIII bacterium]|jgi:F-type H+-transporting ATPase subunit b|nr:F0F1 ATP synthase subunit B [Clostridiales Family XIII bacterium]